MQCAERFASSGALVGPIGQQKAGVIVELCDDCVEPWIPEADLCQMSCHYLTRRQLPRANQVRKIAEAQVANVIRSALCIIDRVRHCSSRDEREEFSSGQIKSHLHPRSNRRCKYIAAGTNLVETYALYFNRLIGTVLAGLAVRMATDAPRGAGSTQFA
jgi:hypothetical protein